MQIQTVARWMAQKAKDDKNENKCQSQKINN